MRDLAAVELASSFHFCALSEVAFWHYLGSLPSQLPGFATSYGFDFEAAIGPALIVFAIALVYVFGNSDLHPPDFVLGRGHLEPLQRAGGEQQEEPGREPGFSSMCTSRGFAHWI